MLPEVIYQPPDIKRAVVQSLHHEQLPATGITADVLRLDLIHPVISGNKWFKLKYYLQQAIDENKEGIITFGGAWSNHLVATACASYQAGLKSIGLVRGQPGLLYDALQDAINYKMQLHYLSREEYADPLKVTAALQKQYPGYLIIPQGGQGDKGVQGAAEILSLVTHSHYTHIACSAGTGTMMAGIVQASLPHQQVIGISSLKIEPGSNSLHSFIRQQTNRNNFSLIYDYHFGGYARQTPQLTTFMNSFYLRYAIPTDFVYTGKLVYGIMDLIHIDYFPAASRILIIHSGGLQGNRSLPPEILCFS